MRPYQSETEKKPILKNTVNQNEHIEKQSVEENVDDNSVDSVKIYNESIESPPRTQETKQKKSPRQEAQKLPFPYPKKSLNKEKNNTGVRVNAKKITDKENSDQLKTLSKSNAKNLSLRVVDKEPSFNSFKEDDQVNNIKRIKLFNQIKRKI